jgi:bifunctional UDP-N-acetylglucosamine pyrophosphorylase/glucosamine-1-phosphate N-acetyltransferase
MKAGNSIALLLAAGKGTRMNSDRAKVLFPLAGKPLIVHVVDAVEAAGFSRTVVIVGHQAEGVRDALRGRRVEFVLQEPQLGTGHAVLCALPLWKGFDGSLAVLAGDAPLIRPQSLRTLLEHHARTQAAVTLLTAEVPDPAGYGRIVRTGGRVVGIVEDKDCGPQERELREINASIYVFDGAFLARALPRVENKNRQGEYYLTDTVHIAFREGLSVEGIVVSDYREVVGINTLEQLARAEQILAERSA